MHIILNQGINNLNNNNNNNNNNIIYVCVHMITHTHIYICLCYVYIPQFFPTPTAIKLPPSWIPFRMTSSAKRHHPRLPGGGPAMRRPRQRRREEHGGLDGGLTGGLTGGDDPWSGSLGKNM